MVGPNPSNGPGSADTVELKIAQQEAERGEGHITILICYVAIAFCSASAFFWAATHPLMYNSPVIASFAVAGLVGAFGILHVLLYRFLVSEYWFEKKSEWRELKYMKVKERIEQRDERVMLLFKKWKKEKDRKERIRARKLQMKKRRGWDRFRPHSYDDDYADEYDDPFMLPESPTTEARKEAFSEPTP